MASMTLGNAHIDVGEEIESQDVAGLEAAFAELKAAYSNASDEQLARAVFFNWVPGIGKDAIVAAAVEQLGSHS